MDFRNFSGSGGLSLRSPFAGTIAGLVIFWRDGQLDN